MSATDHIPAAAAWPTLTEAAALVGVSPSTLSRDPDLTKIRSGRRDLRIPPQEVLRLAELHQKSSLTEVAQKLIDHAEARDSRYVEAVEEDIDAFFAARSSTAAGPMVTSPEELLHELEALLPPDVFKRARVIFATARSYTPGDVASPSELYEDDSAG